MSVAIQQQVDHENGHKVAELMPKLHLSDGSLMPQLGLGTSDLRGTGEPIGPAHQAIKTAIRRGYRLVDTAMLYGNEHVVGAAIRESIQEQLVTREQLFVVTKVWCTAHRQQSVVRACRESLARLQLDYVDLYLIHWPVAYAEDGDPINPKDPATGKLRYSDTHFTETWLGMEQCKELGLARSIGLSNFNHKQCDQILDMCKYRPTVNQVEMHPFLAQQQLFDYSNEKQIVLQAYCPLGAPGTAWAPKHLPVLIEEPLIAVDLAQKHSRSPAQIVLRWHLQRGLSPIPKSINERRIGDNIRVLDFELDAQDMARLAQLDCGMRYCTNTAGEYVDDHPLYPFGEPF